MKKGSPFNEYPFSFTNLRCAKWIVLRSTIRTGSLLMLNNPSNSAGKGEVTLVAGDLQMPAQESGGHRIAGNPDRKKKTLNQECAKQENRYCNSHNRTCDCTKSYFSSPLCSTAMKAFCGISTWPIDFIRFLPSRCFAHNLRFRVISPP